MLDPDKSEAVLSADYDKAQLADATHNLRVQIHEEEHAARSLEQGLA